MTVDFTKERICQHLAEMDLPMEPAFELRKLIFSNPEHRQIILSMYQQPILFEVSDWPEPYLPKPMQHPSPDCSMDRLSYEDEILLRDIFDIGCLDRVLKSADEFETYYKLFNESKKKPNWDLVRVLASDTLDNYYARQTRYDYLLDSGLTARINNGDVIQLDDNIYRLPKRLNIEKIDKDDSKDFFEFSALFYNSIGEYLAEYWCQQNEGRPSELEKIQFANQINGFLKDALISGELPVHRRPIFGIVKYNGYPAPSSNDVLFWHEIRPVLAAAGIKTPDKPETPSKTVKPQAEAVPVMPPENNTKPWLIIDPNDPPPAQPWYTPARYFARQHVIDDSNLLTNKNKLESKVVLSLNTAGIKTSRKGNFSRNGTIKKAWVNVDLG